MAKIERQKRIYRKRIPYGMQNFEDVMEKIVTMLTRPHSLRK